MVRKAIGFFAVLALVMSMMATLVGGASAQITTFGQCQSAEGSVTTGMGKNRVCTVTTTERGSTTNSPGQSDNDRGFEVSFEREVTTRISPGGNPQETVGDTTVTSCTSSGGNELSDNAAQNNPNCQLAQP
jgi:hypothetical protein